MSREVTEIRVTELKALTYSALAKLGLDQQEQQIVADVLLYAQLRDNSQGLIKIIERTVLPDTNKSAPHTSEKTVCVSHINGNGNIGMLVLDLAADKVIENARSTGLAMVSTNNTRSSTGAIGYYASKIANSGLLAIVMAGSPKVMTVYGGVDPVLGTNPIAIGIPTGGDPLVLDMATAAIAWFAVIDAARRGIELPANVALDASGEQTTDPGLALKGALQAFGGTKGAGLALMCEILTGPLSGAAIIGDKEDNRGNLVLAIKPTVLDENGSFTARVDHMLARIKNDRADISLPGERSSRLAQQRVAADVTQIDSMLLNELRQLAST